MTIRVLRCKPAGRLTDPVAFLEDEHLDSRFRKVVGNDRATGARSHDDDFGMGRQGAPVHGCGRVAIATGSEEEIDAYRLVVQPEIPE
jgi:hypothetical protein